MLLARLLHAVAHFHTDVCGWWLFTRTRCLRAVRTEPVDKGGLRCSGRSAIAGLLPPPLLKRPERDGKTLSVRTLLPSSRVTSRSNRAFLQKRKFVTTQSGITLASTHLTSSSTGNQAYHYWTTALPLSLVCCSRHPAITYVNRRSAHIEDWRILHHETWVSCYLQGSTLLRPSS